MFSAPDLTEQEAAEVWPTGFKNTSLNCLLGIVDCCHLRSLLMFSLRLLLRTLVIDHFLVQLFLSPPVNSSFNESVCFKRSSLFVSHEITSWEFLKNTTYEPF